MSEKPSDQAAIVPIREQAIDFYGDTIYAVLVEAEGEQRVYVPIKPISDALGLDWSAQYRRIQRDDELNEVSELIAITAIKSRRGQPQTLALPLEFLAGWLFGVRTSRVDEKLREKIRRYKLECYRVLNEHFQGETLARREPGSTLAQVRATALAVATLAEQQMQMEGDLAETKDLATSAHARLDKAASVFKTFDRRLTDVEQRLTPATRISEEQAAEISLAVKALAHLRSERDPGRDHYGAVFGELYRRFGVSSYKNIRADRYEAVLEWLEAERRRTVGEGSP